MSTLRETMYRLTSAVRRYLAPGAILRAVGELGVLTAVVRLAGMVREAVMARELGVSDQLDAFILAFAVLTFVNAALVQPFSSAVLPTWTKARNADGRSSADRGVALTLRRWMRTVAVIVLGGVLAAPFLVDVLAPDFPPSKQHATATALRLLFVALLFRAPANAATVMLHGEKRFVRTALAPVAIPVATIVALLMPGYRPTAGILALATLIGVAIESIAILHPTVRRLRSVGRAGEPTGGIRSDFPREYRPLVLAALVMGGTALVDQVMAAAISAGSVAVLAFGQRVPAVFLNIVTLAISTAVLPKFADLSAGGEWARLGLLLRRYNRAIILGTTPAVVAIVLFSKAIVALLFEGGEFTEDDVRAVSSVQQFYALQIPFYVVSVVGGRLLTALQVNRWLIAIAAGNLLLNIVGNLLFIDLIGVEGIALSTALVYAASAAAVSAVALRELDRRSSG